MLSFDFDNVSVRPQPVTPTVNGTQNMYLTKIQYVRPAEATKAARLEFTVEQRIPGQATKQSVVYIVDWTRRSEPAYSWQPQAEVERIIGITSTYRPDLTLDQIKAEYKLPTWDDVSEKLVALITASPFADVETTMWLSYGRSGDMLQLGTNENAIRPGKQVFPKFDTTYNKVVPESATPRTSTPPVPTVLPGLSNVPEKELF